MNRMLTIVEKREVADKAKSGHYRFSVCRSKKGKGTPDQTGYGRYRIARERAPSFFRATPPIYHPLWARHTVMVSLPPTACRWPPVVDRRTLR